MTDQTQASQGKSVAELGHEAFWFTLHTALAILALVLAMAGMSLFHPDPDAELPKLVGTLLAFLIPMLIGYLLATRLQNGIANYVWISGLLIFSVVCVWVLDLPTGNGLCEHCGALDKLTRTFFSIRDGSGLMAGQGLAVGTWVPLSLFGYALGSKLAMDSTS